MSDLDDYFRDTIPRLRAWATGRLPRAARGMMDTEDVVQETLLRVLRALDGIDCSHEGALGAYTRTALVNRLRDLYRAAGRAPRTTSFDSRDFPQDGSPLSRAMSNETIARYEAALARLDPLDRVAVMGRVELGFRYAEIAEWLGLPGDDAARMRVNRALTKVKEWMG